MPDLEHQKYLQWTVYRPKTKGYFPFNKIHNQFRILAMSVPSVFWKTHTGWLVWVIHRRCGGASTASLGCWILLTWRWPGQVITRKARLTSHSLTPPQTLQPGQENDHNQSVHSWKSRSLSVLLPVQPQNTNTKRGCERHFSPVFLSHLENGSPYILESWKAWQSSI